MEINNDVPQYVEEKLPVWKYEDVKKLNRDQVFELLKAAVLHEQKTIEKANHLIDNMYSNRIKINKELKEKSNLLIRSESQNSRLEANVKFMNEELNDHEKFVVKMQRINLLAMKDIGIAEEAEKHRPLEPLPIPDFE